MTADAVAEPPGAFAGLLRRLRTEAGLTQEELAEAASLSPRSVSDLERGINRTARKDTARLLADALNLAGRARVEFEAIARGHPAAGSAYGPGGASPGPGIQVAAARRTLPRDIASFTGREPELRGLVDEVASGTDSGGVIGIHAIGGMAGIGKTAFAVHAAHRLSPRFPDGQIFLPLHGHTPGQQPVDPADALANLLMTAGIPVQQIPPDLETRMAVWRDQVAGRQLLLILDDAADSEQVRPLLPSADKSLVLVTSRRHLSALEGSRTISLDTLPPAEAAALLTRLAARPGLSPDDTAVAEITKLCGYLPLAIGLLARQLHHHPAWSPADLAQELGAARDRLELMQAENLSVTAAFNMSYGDLTEAQQRLFRRLGLHPGTDIDKYAAAALSDCDPGTARRYLQALYDHYLLIEPSHGRYRLHDLIREHARALVAREDPGSDRDHAFSRLLDYYQRAAEAADPHLARYTRPGRAASAAPLIAVPELPDSAHALAWARNERRNLLASLDQVTRQKLHGRVVTLTAAMAALLRHDGPWTDAIIRHNAAIGAARQMNDRLAEANALHDLGVVQQLTTDWPSSARSQEAALRIYREIGDQLGQANALGNLGVVRQLTGDYPAATEAFAAAIGIFRSVGDPLGHANALHNLGKVRYLTGGDYPGAAQALEESLDIARGIEDRQGQANALIQLGNLRRLQGDYRDAADALEEALTIAREIGSQQSQIAVLNNLGYVRRQTADYLGAAKAQTEALELSLQIGFRLGQANALYGLAAVQRLSGDHPSSVNTLQAALAIYREIGDRGAEAEALNESGALHLIMGDLDLAKESHLQALEVAREIRGSWDEAHALAGLGRCARAAGDNAVAITDLEQAREIFEAIGDAEAGRVADELDELRRGTG